MAAGKKGGSNRKFGRNENACKAYTAGGMQEKNRKRRMARHLRSHPLDAQAVTLFEVSHGYADSIRVIMNGVSTGERFNARARRKAARKADAGLWIHLRAQRDARRHARKVMAEKLTEQARQQAKIPVAIIQA